MNLINTVRAIALATLLGPMTAHAEDIVPTASAVQIMERNFMVSKVTTLKSQSSMLLIGTDGQKRERKMETLSKLQENGIDSSLIMRFSYPTDISGPTFLQIEHMNSEGDIWVYLPALKKSR